MSKWMSAVIATSLSLGLNAAIAQNTNSDNTAAAQAAPGAIGSYNSMGERQSGLEQYLAEEQQCGGLSGEAKRDCMHLAKVRYEGWAIMQCDLMAGAGKQRCYQNIQANVMSNRTPSSGAVRNSAGSDGNAQTGQAVRPGEEEDKPGRQ